MIKRLVFFSLTLAAPALPALAEADPIALGQRLVATYCESCHNITDAGDSPHAEAPPFRVLHERYQLDWLSEGLVEGLVSGHEDMPEFEFDPIQAEAIVSYLQTLTPAQ